MPYTLDRPSPSYHTEFVILGLPGCLPSGLIGLVDLLNLVDRAVMHTGPSSLAPPRVRVRVAGLTRDPFVDGRGATHRPDVALSEVDHAHAVLVPGFLSDVSVLDTMAPSWSQAQRWLRDRHAAGAWVLGSCAGSFAIGLAGLLDGRRCTTTWWLHDALKQRFPHGDWAYGAGLTEDTRVVTAGGPMSWVDIGLAAVHGLCGPEVARALRDFAVLGAVAQRDALMAPTPVAHDEDLIRRATRVVRVARNAPLSTTELARALGLSLRTLHRRFAESTGETPLEFIRRVRIETARALLDTPTLPVKAIAQETGWNDEGSFRRAFRMVTGQTPTDYRRSAAARRELAARATR